MVIAIIIAVALVIAIVLVALGRRSAGGGARRDKGAAVAGERYGKLHLSPTELTVDGETAVVSFLVTPAVRSGEGFPPLNEAFRLTAGLVAALRDSGVEPESMSMRQMTLGLLEAAGYEVAQAPDSQAYLATRSGSTTFVAVVDHEEGDHPELSETAVNSFLAAFYSSGAERGLLFSDKFCPHVVCEKERRDKRVTFITRERLQDFVDSTSTPRTLPAKALATREHRFTGTLGCDPRSY